MKFALNGALTIGTLDGANVEMLEQLGEDNIFIFGLTADEVARQRAEGHTGQSVIDKQPMLRSAIDSISSGVFCQEEPGRYAALMDAIRGRDWWMIAADFRAYWDTQRRLDVLWKDRDAWNEIAVRNTARMSWFSSDRSIGEYARDIWRAGPHAGDR